MRYTKSEILSTLHETPGETMLKEYFNSLSPLGDDFACRSLTIRPNIVKSMKLFATKKVKCSSAEIAAYMIKGSLLTYNNASCISAIKNLMLNNEPLKGIIKSILKDTKLKLELAKNLYYLRNSNPVSTFELRYKDDESKEEVLGCITRLNSFLEECKKAKEEKKMNVARKIKTIKPEHPVTSQTQTKSQKVA